MRPLPGSPAYDGNFEGVIAQAQSTGSVTGPVDPGLAAAFVAAAS